MANIQTAYLLPGASLLTGDESGVNETYRGIIETAVHNQLAYVKLLPTKQLINEAVAANLGKAIGLPIPDSYLVSVSRADYPHSKMLQDNNLDSAIAFGAASIGFPDLKRRLIQMGDAAIQMLKTTWTGWQHAMAYDEWIANSDRHAGNLLIGTAGEVWLIDHSHAFTGPNWGTHHLVPNAALRNQIAENFLPGLPLPEKVATLDHIKAIVAAYEGIDAELAIKECQLAPYMPEEEIHALQHFIKSRVGNLVEIISHRLGLPVLSLTGHQ